MSTEALHYRSFSLRRALQLHGQLWASNVSAEVSSVQFGVLVFLAEHGALSQRELGRLAWLDKSTLAELLRRMQDAGYVVSERSAVDRRTNTVAITATGRATLDALRPAALQVNELLTADMSAEESASLDRLLNKLTGMGT